MRRRRPEERRLAIVGIVANPAAGKDIRRLVAQGRFVPLHEMVNVLRRVLAGLSAAGVDDVVVMPDPSMLGRTATDGAGGPRVELLDMVVLGEEQDSTNAARLMSGMGVGCIVTLGGDGTNRAVVKGWRSAPIVPISTGTNNVFPSMVEGTVAGLAAGVFARGLVDVAAVGSVHRVLEVRVGGELKDLALIDVAVSTEEFVGARAIWDVGTLHEIFLTRADASGIGLSAIGARLRPGPSRDAGLRVRLGDGGTVVRAPVAPGTVSDVPVRDWSELRLGVSAEVSLRPCTIALDGERAFRLGPGQTAHVTLSDRGPRVVSVEAALREATLAGAFTNAAGS